MSEGMTVQEWVDRERKRQVRDVAGPWRATRTPYLVEFPDKDAPVKTILFEHARSTCKVTPIDDVVANWPRREGGA